jgi:branched-chain amino acid transport system substrate-binding protein
MKKLVIALIVSLLMVGCGAAKETGTIKIGANLELSGGGATYGESELKGIELAVEEINKAGGIDGRQIEVVKVDNKTDGAESTNAMMKLATQDKVSVVVGPAFSGNSKSAIQPANENKVPFITPSGTNDTLTLDADGKVQPYVFRACFKDSFQGVTMASFAFNTLGAKKAVVYIDNSSDYSKGLVANFKESFTKLGGTIVAEEGYVQGDTDFNAVLTKIKALEFDVLFVPGYVEEVGLIIRQARAIGLDIPVLGGDGFDSPKMIELAGAEALNNVHFSTFYSALDEDPLVQAFITAFTAKYNEAPNAFAAMGYDATLLAVDAIKRAGKTDGESIMKALAATAGFKGVTGSITMDEFHNPVKAAVVIELVNGVQTKAVRVQP